MKSDGQVAHETFHAELSRAGVNSRGGWEPLDPRRKVAWDAAAASVVERTIDTVRPLFVGVDPGREEPGVVMYATSDGKLCFPHGVTGRKPLSYETITAGHSFSFPPLRPAQLAALRDAYFSPTSRVPCGKWRTAFGTAIHEQLEKEFTKMHKSTTTEDEIKGAQFEIEELRTEVSNLNDELSEVRQERETLRATLDRGTEQAMLLEGTVKRLEGHAAQNERNANAATERAVESDSRRLSAEKRERDTAAQLDTAMLVIDQLVRQRDNVDPTQPNPFDVRRIKSSQLGRNAVELRVIDSREVMGLVLNPFVRTKFTVVKAERPAPRGIFFDVFEQGRRRGLLGERF